MAQDIVGGLFGIAPSQILQQRVSNESKDALAFANLSPQQQAQYGMYMAGRMGGRAIGGLLGAEDAQMTQARQMQQVKQWIAQSGVDINTPEGLAQAAQYAQSIGATEGALFLGQQAMQMRKGAAEEQYKLAQAQAALKDKLPNAAKELIAAGYTPDSPEFQAKMRQIVEAGITGKAKGDGVSVNLGGFVDKIFNKAAADKEGEEVGKQITAWGKVAANAPQALQTANTAIDLIDKAFTGAGAESLMNLSKFARQMGVPVSDKASNTEISVALTKKLISEQGRTFPGSQSNLELQQILQKNPNALQEPRTQRYLWDLYKQDVRTAKESYKSAQAHKQTKGSYAGYDVYEGGAQASQSIIDKTNRYNTLAAKARSTGRLTPQEAAEAKQLEADLGENK